MRIRRNSRAFSHACSRALWPGWGRPKPPTEHLEAERCLQPVTNRLVFVTELYDSAQMTDYSGAIFALIAITSVLTAAVVFVLAQPTDLPVIKKTQG